MKSCTLPSIIVELDNNSNNERGIKRPIDHEEQLDIPETVDNIKIEEDVLDSVYNDNLNFEKKLKVKLNSNSLL